MTLVSGRVPDVQRGAAVGRSTAFYDIFVAVGSLAFGLLADAGSTESVFIVVAAAVLLAAVVLARQARREGLLLVDTTPDG